MKAMAKKDASTRREADRPAAQAAEEALRRATAAVLSVEAEADRWGGSAKPAGEQPERFW